MSDNGNGNGRRTLFDPLLTLIRLFHDKWKMNNALTGNTTIVDGQKAREELEDKLDPTDETDN
ncbi:hypothetical protein NIES4071_19640 [Calothrix sp. NIES-4071]|nr:hypothetical protein NIES4071_19640 [Calothrix sp. NIES-4071]BAZ56297.1 hypothetical protein NIES4105_19590 [Calothrix sp. NIES-4105]